MLLEIVLFTIIGIFLGTLTGLIPGIHTNFISAIILSVSASVLYFLSPIYLMTIITSMAIAHTFVSFIPSVFLGCPDTDTELSILPGHEMLKKGQGYEAIKLSSYGGLIAIITLGLIAFPASKIIPKLQTILLTKIPLIQISILPLILITTCIALLSLEKNKLSATFAFILAGILGLITLNLEMNEPLLPLLTGLFGASTLILSIKTKTKIPLQRIETEKQDLDELKKPFASAFLGSFIASPLLSLLPGLGSGQAAIIGDTLSKRLNKQSKENSQKDFLVLLGATNTLVMGFSFVALYAISRTRTGAAMAIEKLAGAISIPLFATIIAITIISGLISFVITLRLSKYISQKVNKINYTTLSKITLLILILLTTAITGTTGLIILTIATLTGIYCISLNIRRTNMMGCLLLPTIIFYLGT